MAEKKIAPKAAESSKKAVEPRGEKKASAVSKVSMRRRMVLK